MVTSYEDVEQGIRGEHEFLVRQTAQTRILGALHDMARQDFSQLLRNARVQNHAHAVSLGRLLWPGLTADDRAECKLQDGLGVFTAD